MDRSPRSMATNAPASSNKALNWNAFWAGDRVEAHPPISMPTCYLSVDETRQPGLWSTRAAAEQAGHIQNLHQRTIEGRRVERTGLVTGVAEAWIHR